MDFYKLVKPIIAGIIILFIFSLLYRMPDIDDGWIGEHAYWLSELGYVKSELMHGITKQEIRHIAHHKLFTINGAAFIKLFGFSLYTLKSVSLMWALVFVAIFFNYVRRKLGFKAAWLAILLFTVNALVFQYSFVYRPEIMVMTLGFVSFMFLEKYLNDKRLWLLTISGIAAGLAAAAHLNGLIFIGAGFLTLVWQRRFKASMLFGLFTIPGFAVYFYDFTREFNFKFWFYQVSEAPSFHASEVMPTSIQYFLKILSEHLRFFHSPKEIIMSLLLIFSIILNFKALKTKTIYLHYLFLIVVILSFITAHTTSKYLLLHVPLITLIILPAVMRLFDKEIVASRYFSKKFILNTGIVLLTGFVLIHTVFNVILAVNKYDTKLNAAITTKYFNQDTQELSILAPLGMVFNELPKYRRIQSDLSIIEMNNYKDISSQTFFATIDTLKIDAMMISEEYIMKYGLTSVTDDIFRQKGFKVLGRENGYVFLRKDRN
ncbi:MAG: ArnT family glycosyltransferase [Chloroflexota bacterium]